MRKGQMEDREMKFRYVQHVPNECLCNRCGKVYTNPRKLACKHIACKQCIAEMSKYEGRCGICNTIVDTKKLRSCK